jgi:hypothetical protein
VLAGGPAISFLQVARLLRERPGRSQAGFRPWKNPAMSRRP